jgi:exopolyphosphatase/pppGpp-phosphohydrolase
MIKEQIEQLRQRRENITEEFRGKEIEFNTEIERIDRAIAKFEAGVGILHGEPSSVVQEKPAKSVAQAIGIILNDAGEPLHVKRIMERLRFLGYQTAESTVSGTLQTYAKKNKKFKKTAPATYSVLEKKSKGAG